MNGALSIIDLIPLHMAHFDVIIGMDWLSKTNAKIDCGKKTITFVESKGGESHLEGEKIISPPCFVSVAKTRRLLQKGCQGFLCIITLTKPENCQRKTSP